MIKSLKSLAITMIILSILCCIGGMGFSKLADANRGSKVSSGRMINGEFVATDVGVIGANKQGEETAKAMSVVFYALSGMLILAGIAFATTAKKKNDTKIIKKHGIILEKQTNNYESVIVEFDDGIRKKLLVEPPLIVAEGDKGVIGFKGNLLVEFTKK